MKHQIVMNIGGKFRREKLEGRDHLVVPCVMLKEGVINGSAGPLLYPENEIEKSSPSWNGMPIVVNHPQDDDGEFISARNSEVFNARKVGVLLETEYDGKLRTECWFDEARVKAVDKRVYNAIVKKKKMEVSTGLDLDLKEEEGEFDGVKYTGVTSNFRPDHLAVLPDKIGACSIAMGAGLFANVSKEPESVQEVFTRSIENALKSIGATIVDNELSFSDTTRQVCDLLSAKFGEPGKYWNGWVQDTFDGYIVFYDKSTLYRHDYSVENDVVKLVGDAKEVQRVVSYVGNTTVTNGSEGANMAFDKKKFVDQLIANGDAAETDREELMKTPDKVLSLWDVQTKEEAAIVEDEEETPPAKPAKKAAAKKEEVLAATNAAELTEEQWLKAAPKSLKSVLNRAQAQEEKQRKRFVKTIMNSKGNQFKEEWLLKQEIDVLEGMAGIAIANTEEDDEDGDESPLARRRVSYEGAAGTYAANEDDEDEDEAPMKPVKTVNFADPRRKVATAK